MSDMDTESINLDEKLSVTKAAPLFETLKGLDGKALTLCAKNVAHIDMSCAQILMAASAHWKDNETAFVITDPSDGFKGSLTTLGLTSLIEQ